MKKELEQIIAIKEIWIFVCFWRLLLLYAVDLDEASHLDLRCSKARFFALKRIKQNNYLF